MMPLRSCLVLTRNFAAPSRLVNVSAAFSSSLSSSDEQSQKKGFLARKYDEYSISQQQERITMAERLFRFAQMRADDPRWYGPGRIGRDFRPRHAMLTMHLWFLHKRLINDKTDNHSSLMVQEELFDIFWDDTQKRIRAEGVAEMTVNKHLNDVQQYTFQHLTHYDHAFTEFELKPKARFEELCGLFWVHVLMRDEDHCSDQVQRMAYYIDSQYNNIINRLPEKFWKEGRLAWVDIPDFSDLRSNKGKLVPAKPLHEDDVLPEGWYKALTNAGEAYYWNPEKRTSQWERPKPEE